MAIRRARRKYGRPTINSGIDAPDVQNEFRKQAERRRNAPPSGQAGGDKVLPGTPHSGNDFTLPRMPKVVSRDTPKIRTDSAYVNSVPYRARRAEPRSKTPTYEPMNPFHHNNGGWGYTDDFQVDKNDNGHFVAAVKNRLDQKTNKKPQVKQSDAAYQQAIRGAADRKLKGKRPVNKGLM